MITVSGRSFDASALTEEYPQSSIEQQTLSAMSQSAENYRYDTLDQLKFELKLRREIVNAAIDLDRSRFGFATFHKSRCNPEYWERTPNGGFRLKDGAKPGEAIRDIYENGGAYANECATAMMIVYYKALLETYGEALFDELFPDIYLMNWHAIDPLLRAVGMPRNSEDTLPGDRKYFENPDVNPKTPEWQGENTIALPDGRYYGHGVGIRTAEQMVRALNANRRMGATRSAYLRDATGRPDFRMLSGLPDRYAARSAHLVWTFPPALAHA
jgi:protein-glutamine gamma-glutamyltransferase